MTFGKSHANILFIDNKQCTWYIGKKKAISFPIPKTAIFYGEVQEDDFSQVIDNSISTYQILPSSVLIVLSAKLTFDKKISEITGDSQERIEDFSNMIPYESPVSRIYSLENEIRVSGTNKQLCEILVTALGKKSFSVLGIVPFTVLHVLLPKVNNPTDLSEALSSIDILKQRSLIEIEKIDEKLITYDIPNMKSPRLISLVGVFAVLIIILGALIILQMKPSTKKITKKEAVHTVIPTSTATPVPSVTPTVSPTQLEQ